MGTRWLLYDAGCSVCAALAREVEALSGGRLRVRSLREPEVQALLDQAHPGWQWEPMLVEIEGEQVRVFAGLAMRMRLLQILGPARALRVAQAVARMGGPVLGVDWGRRRLLRQSLALAGLALLRRIPGGTHAPRTAGSAPPRLGPGEGELWEGFVLLPEGAPLPSFVTCAPAPILCQSADPEKDLWGETLEAPDEGPLRAAPGLPVPMLEGWPLRQTTVIRFQQDGRLFAALLEFGEEETIVRLWASPVYPQPFPVWPVYLPDRPGMPIPPEKVFFTPRPGVLRPTLMGVEVLWIQEGILYTLSIQRGDREVAAGLIQALRMRLP